MTDGGVQRTLWLPRLPGRPTAWAVAGGLALLALVTVATASTPVAVVSQPRPGAAPSVLVERPAASTPPTATSHTSAPLSDLSSLPSLPPVLVTMLQLVVAGLLLWAMSLLFRFVRRHAPRLRTRVVPRRSLEPLPALPDELLESAEVRLALLHEGSPRNAIVTCWLDLEEAAAAAGLPRHPHETAAEYTVRVLKTWDVAPDAMGRLAELYREARYSRHPITERHRHEAVSRLSTVHEDLARAAMQTGPATAPA